MSNSRYSQLILFDLDGTALESAPGSTLSLRLKNAIIASRSDIGVAIATGRSWGHFWHVIAEVAAYLEYCIISGGSQIVDCRAQRIIWQYELSREQIDGLNAIAVCYQKSLSFNNGTQTVSSALQIKDARPTIVYLLGIQQVELEGICTAVAQIPSLHVAVTDAWGGMDEFVLHITHIEANKGTATRELLKLLQLSKARVTAIGDGLNDLPMFEIVGTPLAIAGSIIDGHELSTGTVMACADDGVAVYLEMVNRQGGAL